MAHLLLAGYGAVAWPCVASVSGEGKMKTGLVPITFIVVLLLARPASGQRLDAIAEYATVPIEQRADVILLVEPHSMHAFDVPARAERVVHGSVLRVDKGVVPQMIVHTPATIVAPLRAGVPAKLFLKKFKDRDAYYIIGVFPAWYGEKP